MDFYTQIGVIFNPNNNPFFGAKKHEDDNIEDAVIIEEIPNETNNDYE